jgi:hypothetical protein
MQRAGRGSQAEHHRHHAVSIRAPALETMSPNRETSAVQIGKAGEILQAAVLAVSWQLPN